jgi:ABC-type glycerol-3-phosphate transport system permease component
MEVTRIGRPARHSATWLLRRGASSLGLYVVLVLLGALFGLPFLWALFTSLKTPMEIFIFPPQLLPSVPQWGNYVEIWKQAPMAIWFWNSVKVTILAMIGQLLSASLRTRVEHADAP